MAATVDRAPLPIRDVELRSLELTLRDGGVGNARQRWHTRRALQVWLHTEEGIVGRGEAAPLPGFSPDTFEQAEDSLRRLKAQGLPPLPLEGAPLGAVRQVLDGHVLSASARFAVETALLDVVGRALGLPVHRLLGGPPSPWMPLAAPLDLHVSPGQAVRRARALTEDGYCVIKAKVGRQLEQELTRLEAIRAAFPALGIRVDANGTLDPVRDGDWLQALARLGPEYIEEPFARFAESPGAAHCPVPVALDESLLRAGVEPRLPALIRHAGVQVVVLKPAMLGGLLRCVSLAETVRAEGAEGVVSHLFDGPVGLTVACELALALGSTRAAGLAPHAALDAWPEPERPTALSSGRLHAHSRSGLGLERGGEGTG